MSHNHRRDPVRGGSSENSAPRADLSLARAIIVAGDEERRRHRYVAVGIEQLEAAKAKYKVVKGLLDNMLREERRSQIRFEQVKSQIHRAGMRFAEGLLPFSGGTSQRQLERAVVTVGREETRRRTHEATVPVEYDQLQAALVALRVIEADLDKATSNDHKLRIKIAQAEDQLRRAGITPC